MRRAGLRSEIVLTLAILLGAALLLGGFLFLRYSEQSQLEQYLQQARLGTRLAASVLTARDPGLREPHPEALEQLQAVLEVRGWWLYDRELQPLFTMSSDGLLPPSAGELRQLLIDQSDLVEISWPGLLAFPGDFDASWALVAVPVRSAGKSVGVLAVRYSLASLLVELVAAQKWLFIYALAFGGVLAATGLLLLSRNVVKPAQRLLEATRNVTSGDLSVRLDSSGPAEIAELAESFNAMIGALHTSRRETEAHIESLHAANTALQTAQNQLIRSEKLATVGYLAAGMAHEIGNPLGALTGYLGVLQQDLAGTPQAEILAHSAVEIERIDRLVRELLDYAAPGTASADLIDPWQAVLEALGLLDSQGALKGCQLDCDHQLRLPPIRIDRHKLVQVLVNLLLNSRDACGGSGRLALDGFAGDGQVVLRLTDDGCGIPENQRDSIFEPFFTTKDPGKGRGLGLAICQRIVDEAGGDIRCESAAGQGCSFILTFPQGESGP